MLTAQSRTRESNPVPLFGRQVPHRLGLCDAVQQNSGKTVGTAGFEPAISASQGRRRRPSWATFRGWGAGTEVSPVNLGTGVPPWTNRDSNPGTPRCERGVIPLSPSALMLVAGEPCRAPRALTGGQPSPGDEPGGQRRAEPPSVMFSAVELSIDRAKVKAAGSVSGGLWNKTMSRYPEVPADTPVPPTGHLGAMLIGAWFTAWILPCCCLMSIVETCSGESTDLITGIGRGAEPRGSHRAGRLSDLVFQTSSAEAERATVRPHATSGAWSGSRAYAAARNGSGRRRQS